MAEEGPHEVPQQDDEVPYVDLPSRTPLPPPPDIQYQRPTLGQTGSAPSRNASRGETPGGPGEDSGPGSHGAGLAAGSTFVVGIIAGATVGNWVDQHYIHTSMPWATLVMTLLGAAAGFSNMLRLLARSDRNRKKK